MIHKDTNLQTGVRPAHPIEFRSMYKDPLGHPPRRVAQSQFQFCVSLPSSRASGRVRDRTNRNDKHTKIPVSVSAKCREHT